MANRPYAQDEVGHLIHILECQIEVLNRHLIRKEGSRTMEVGYVYVCKIPHRTAPSMCYKFDVVTLKMVPPKIVLEFMFRLLYESVLSVREGIPLVPGYHLDASVSALLSIPDRISEILGVECRRRPNILYIEMKVKVFDEHHKVKRYYTPTVNYFEPCDE